MSNPFHVGQKVVFMGHRNTGKCKGFTYPEVNKVYTVREIGPYTMSLILLEEIVNPIDRGVEPGFGYYAFRPVVPRKTSIEIFTNILNTQRVRTDA